MTRSDRERCATTFERAAAIDAPITEYDRRAGLDPELTRFITVLSAVTASSLPFDPSRPASAEAHDEVFAESVLLRSLSERAPEVAVGPLARAGQIWVQTGAPSWRPEAVMRLDQEQFALEEQLLQKASTKPSTFGLFASTAALGTNGMWAAFLELRRHSSLFPKPWTVWSLAALNEADVVELTSATDWVRLLERYARIEDGLGLPGL